MKIAALQMVATPDVDRNLQAAAKLVSQAAAQGALLVQLPEYFCLMGQRDGDKLRSTSGVATICSAAIFMALMMFGLRA